MEYLYSDVDFCFLSENTKYLANVRVWIAEGKTLERNDEK